jgi:hypothetical protein
LSLATILGSSQGELPSWARNHNDAGVHVGGALLAFWSGGRS